MKPGDKKLHIMIADDHKMFMDGVRAALEIDPSLVITGQARNGEEALELLKKITCDVVLLDINMPKINGIEACKKIKELYPGIKILALSMHNDQEHIRKMIEAGANGYAMKNIDPEELMLAIQKIYDGEQYFSTDVAVSMMAAGQSGAMSNTSGEKNILSKREIEIVRLVAHEMTSGQIGEKLFISEATVETHRRNIIQKLGVKSTVGMIKYAMQHGIL